MKVIINVNKKSAFSKYNGLAFDAAVYNEFQAVVNINGNDTDFKYQELIIQDFQNEANKSLDDLRWFGANADRCRIDEFLRNYQLYKKIQFVPEYKVYQ